jgi:type 1 glutamine amidotransferase
MEIQMSARISPLLFIALGLGLGSLVRADEPRPLKVLWCTGGGFHDFKGLTPLLNESMQQYANVRFDVAGDYKAWAKKGFADDYDAVVYFFSFHDKEAQPVVDNLAATIHAGKPALVIHGTLHAFRELGTGRDAYCEAIGLTSVAHDPKRPLATKKVTDHPILRAWPDDWKTPSDELYQNIKVWPGATPLLTAYSETSKKDHVVAWVNQYGKGRVFGTSLGHDRETAAQDSYHRLLADGLLWACDKLDEGGKPKPGYAGAGAGAKSSR